MHTVVIAKETFFSLADDVDFGCRESNQVRKPAMPLASMKDLLGAAQAGGYAVCYCESWNLESFQAVVEAAEEMGSPIIAGFNGGFLRHRSRLKPEKLIYYAAIRSALQESSAPIAFLLNETDDFEQIRDGIELGFNAVMV